MVKRRPAGMLLTDFLNIAWHEQYWLIRTKQIKTRKFTQSLKYWFCIKNYISPKKN
jgi:hypothetical protein